MCGIAGFTYQPGAHDAASATAIARMMADAIKHRGPDGAGEWVGNGIALAHRRLSIIDLTEAGAQPMSSSCGRYILVFNGEIYNHIELRSQLRKEGRHIAWKGGSDTETLIELISAYDVLSALSRISGMFAFAVWDKLKMELHLCRDRFGEKPLYYGWQGAGLVRGVIFASELKCFKKHPSFERLLNQESIRKYFERNYIPAPLSIYERVFKVRPGCFVTVSIETEETIETSYYSVFDTALKGKKDTRKSNLDELSEELIVALESAISTQLISDRPVGAFLSGGVDSSTIVALMQRVSSSTVKTFTVGFEETAFNEAKDAARIASYLGTDHNEIYVSSNDALNLIPKLASIYCEPFADFSQIPTILLSKFASNSVTVALTGDAGDELFGGYSRYNMLDNLWRRSKFPRQMLSVATRLGVGLPYRPEIYRAAVKSTNFFMSNSMVSLRNFDRFEGALSATCLSEFYYRYLSHQSGLKFVKADGFGDNINYPVINDRYLDLPEFSNVEKMMLLDIENYLPDDLLVKVDRAAMSASLETRIPFLDQSVVSLAWRIPSSLKSKNGIGKIILRNINSKLIPRQFVSPKKKGFGVPIGAWLRGPLRPWADSCFNSKSMEDAGIISSSIVKVIWHQHLSGNANWEYFLWNLLMFQGWLDEQME
jgi:asparagine synthase (glutamine-hydrolysing)